MLVSGANSISPALDAFVDVGLQTPTGGQNSRAKSEEFRENSLQPQQPDREEESQRPQRRQERKGGWRAGRRRLERGGAGAQPPPPPLPGRTGTRQPPAHPPPPPRPPPPPSSNPWPMEAASGAGDLAPAWGTAARRALSTAARGQAAAARRTG
ncbi:Src substrate cortactin [Manis javanica]|nr:Src substrate cortactin [Manis javanica]